MPPGQLSAELAWRQSTVILKQMRSIITAIVAAAAIASPPLARGHEQAAIVAPAPCAARVTGPLQPAITWHSGPVDDLAELDQWCRAVGPPLAVSPPPQQADRVP